jgi:Na+/H+-dicarboxylate symporter
LPIEAIALIAGVDRIIEMMTTSINITGDAVTAVIVAKSEDQLNEAIYNDNTELTD